jgi:hypothetical protein
MSYQIGRGEQGVLTFEPYKSILLPHWRFRTIPIARKSSQTLYEHFLSYYDQEDFVGMDMARKFIQMGMTRAKRYANYKGGRKYIGKVHEDGKGYGRRGREVLEKSEDHEGKDEKLGASQVFRDVWEKCKAHEGYQRLKEEFLDKQKEWQKERKEILAAEHQENKVKDEPTPEETGKAELPGQGKMLGRKGDIKVKIEDEDIKDEPKEPSRETNKRRKVK